MKEKDIYNLKGTISREIFNYQDVNKKGKFGLQLYANIVNTIGSFYMAYNNIPDNDLTFIVRNGVYVFSIYELILVINDIKKSQKSKKVLNELLRKIDIDEKIEELIPLVYNDGIENVNNIILDENSIIKEYIEDNKYKCEYHYMDKEPLDITDKVKEITGGVKKSKTK